MTKLYLIRHAEAEGNLYRRVHGQYNSLITDNGYRQIKALEARFQEIPIDVVYSSDLFRTMTTAQAIYKPKNLPLHTRRDLREIDLGDWEDRSFAGVDRRDHARMKLFHHTSPLFQAPNGESFLQIRQRGVAALRDIAAHHPNQTVAVFAHGTIIRNTLAELRGLGLEETSQIGHSDNTAVSLLEFEGHDIRIVFSDDNSHLTPEISTLAQQHWWNKDSKKRDINLWFAPAALDGIRDQALYRRCQEETWQALYGSLAQYDGEAPLQKALHQWDKAPGTLSIAMADSAPVGLLQLDFDAGQGTDRGDIAFLYLLPEHRGNNLGIQLVGKAVSLYRPMGRQYLRLLCPQENTAALRFCEKFGFRTVETLPGGRTQLHKLEKYIGYGVPDYGVPDYGVPGEGTQGERV